MLEFMWNPEAANEFSQEAKTFQADTSDSGDTLHDTDYIGECVELCVYHMSKFIL